MANAHDIVALVADSHGVTPADIYSKRKPKHIVEARFKAIAEVRRARPEWSVTRLSTFFDRDMATIRNALRKTGEYA
jgi:chromosomal replication initiation ATPase DnaA